MGNLPIRGIGKLVCHCVWGAGILCSSQSTPKYKRHNVVICVAIVTPFWHDYWRNFFAITKGKTKWVRLKYKVVRARHWFVTLMLQKKYVFWWLTCVLIRKKPCFMRIFAYKRSKRNHYSICNVLMVQYWAVIALWNEYMFKHILCMYLDWHTN